MKLSGYKCRNNKRFTLYIIAEVEMKKINEILFFILVIIFFGCTKPTAPDDKVLDTDNYIHLQNQTDHSGVLIKIIDSDAMAITDSLGCFTLPKVANGEYTLQAKYPFFKIVEQSVVIADSVLQTEIEIELEQQLQFWVEPAETTLTMADKTRFWEFRGYAKNISDTVVSGTTFSIPENWGLIPESINWNFGQNNIIDAKRCYGDFTHIGPTDILGRARFYVEPGDTWGTIYKDVWLLGYECTPPGRTYLFFYIFVDEKHFEEYYYGRFFVDGKIDDSQIINPLTKSLFKKRELFRPAIINFTN